MNMTAVWMRPALVMIVGCFLLCGCAFPAAPDDLPVPDSAAAQHARLVPHKGPPRKIQIRAVHIPATDLNRYPELTAPRVGFGLSRILVNVLSDTGRFDLLEAQQVVQQLGQRWRQTEAGIDVYNDAATTLARPEFLISLKVFDIDVCEPEKRNILGRQRSTCNTRVGVQVRIENTSGQFIPGSTHPLSPQGRYRHIIHVSRFGDSQTTFGQSAVGKATTKAVRYAVLQALERFDHQGW